MIDVHIGVVGVKQLDAFKEELRLDILGQKIKKIREKKHLAQEQSGKK